jgi:uncharacterized cupredoxin-like copper-binding protein
MQTRRVVALAIALIFTTVTLPVAAQNGTSEAEQGEKDPIDAAIELGEFYIKPPSTPLIAGQPYRFVVTNTGLATHELVIEPAGAVDVPLEKNGQESEVEDIAKGVTKELLWTFDEPGDYEFACYIADHDKHGMLTAFTVLPGDATPTTEG